MPEAVPRAFYRDRRLGADLMQCGVAMRSDALSWCTKVKLAAGYVVVLATAGGSGPWQPHLPILMTAGGVPPQQQGREGAYFPLQVVPQQWQYDLCTMLQQRVGPRALQDQIDALWRQSPRGLVADGAEGKVPAGGAGWADYVAPYVVRPPLALRRMRRYDGPQVRYWENEHTTKQRQEEAVAALTFSGRRGQHMLPQGCPRIRSYGLHAPCKATKGKMMLTVLLGALGRLLQGTYRIGAQKPYRERGRARTGRDPLRGRRCGRERRRWQVWPPRSGVVYDELQAIKRGRYGPCRGRPPGAGVDGDEAKAMTQLVLTDLEV